MKIILSSLTKAFQFVTDQGRGVGGIKGWEGRADRVADRAQDTCEELQDRSKHQGQGLRGARQGSASIGTRQNS